MRGLRGLANSHVRGCEKSAVHGLPVAPGAYQFALIGQNLLSALLLFFFGLALRNYFKVK